MESSILEFSVSLNRFHLHQSFIEPNVFIEVQTSNGAHSRWQVHSKTETVQCRGDCNFIKTICFKTTDNVEISTKLQLVFRRQRKNNQGDFLASAFCVVERFVSSSSPLHTLDMCLNGAPIGTVQVNVLKISQLLQKDYTNLIDLSPETENSAENQNNCENIFPCQNVLIKPCKKSYFLKNSQDEGLHIYESMFETPMSFSVPIQFLEMCRSENNRAMTMLENMGNLRSALERQRLDLLKMCQKHSELYVNRLNSMRQHFDNTSAACIKRSADKTSFELEFVPTNLHVQYMKVCRDDTSSDGRPASPADSVLTNELLCVTVGATSSHCTGFKQGGLFDILSPYNHNPDTKTSRRSPIKFDQLSRCLQYGEIDERIEIDQLVANIQSKCSNLKLLLNGVSKELEKSCISQINILEQLSKSIGSLLSIFDGERIQRAHDVMSINLNNSTIDLPNINEDLKLKIKAAFASLVKVIDSQDNDSESSRMETCAKLIEQITDSADQLKLQGEMALFHSQFVTNSHLNYYTDAFYRRRTVFSQALSMCVCGVNCKLLQHLCNKDMDALLQFEKCGILLQVESLLSTYGNENGMIQDYVIGVMDLHKVKFQMKLKTEECYQNPELTGSSLFPVVIIYLNEEHFKLLPVNLQNDGFIKVVPVFFNVGINQEQTLAEKFGGSVLQEYLNREALGKLSAYYKQVSQNTRNSFKLHCHPRVSTISLGVSPTPSNNIRQGLRGNISSILPRVKSTIVSSVQPTKINNFQITPVGKSTNELLDDIRQAINLNKNKPVEILHISAEICRRMNGVRVTSCKSAKDRTAMSVTLEQSSLMLQQYGISEKSFIALLSAMRSNGTRIENTVKNVGQRRFAFASVQLMTFPKLYRPPDGTYGKVET